MDRTTILGQRLRQLREERGLLQKDIANKFGITDSAIGHYERGDRTPDADTLSRFAEFFQVTTDYLLGRTGIRKPIETIAAHRSDDPMNELPEDARKSLEEYREYLFRKHGLIKDLDVQQKV